MLRLLRQISLRELRKNWGRTSLAIGGIAAGVALIVAINIINHSVVDNFRDTIELIAGPAQLQVTLGLGEVGFPESTIDVVREDPDVAAAVPLVRGTLAPANAPDEALQLFGVDLMAEDDLRRYHLNVDTEGEDLLAWLADPLSVVLPAIFATHLDVGIGQKLALTTPKGVVELTVRGLLTPDGLGQTFGGQIALMDLPAAQSILIKEHRIDQIDIVLRPGADVATAEARLTTALPSLTVERPAQRGRQYETIMSSFQAMLTGLSLLCLVAGVYIIYNTTSTAALHRAFVFARLRVIGADSGQLFRLLMLEAALVGLIGAPIGVIAGIILAHVLSGMVAQSMSVIFQLRFPLETLALDLSAQLGIGALGIGAALFASYFAARRVTSLHPLDVIRANLHSLSLQRPPAILLWVWLGLILISAAALALQVFLGSVAWGNIGSTLWVASSAVVAIPLVNALAPGCSRLLARFYGAEGRVAAESLFRSTTRTGVTVAALALVLTIAITSASLSLSHRESVANQVTVGVLSSDLLVSAVTTEGGWLETPLPGDLEAELRDVTGVRSVEPLRYLPGQLYRGQRIALAALSSGLFDPERFSKGWVQVGDATLAAAAVNAGKGLLISLNFAAHFGIALGDRVDLDTPTGPLGLEVVGIVPDYTADRGMVAISHQLFIERWQDTTVNWLLVFLEPGASREAVRTRIGGRLGGRHLLKISSPAERAAFHAERITDAYAFTYALQLLVVIITVAGIFDLLTAAIWERRRELALWRVIGADERAVRRSVVIESATIGLIGSALGIVVGLITAWIWVHITYRYLLGFYTEYYFAFGTTVWLVALMISTTIAVGYGAARHATRQPVLDGIQIE